MLSFALRKILQNGKSTHQLKICTHNILDQCYSVTHTRVTLKVMQYLNVQNIFFLFFFLKKNTFTPNTFIHSLKLDLNFLSACPRWFLRVGSNSASVQRSHFWKPNGDTITVTESFGVDSNALLLRKSLKRSFSYGKTRPSRTRKQTKRLRLRQEKPRVPRGTTELRGHARRIQKSTRPDQSERYIVNAKKKEHTMVSWKPAAIRPTSGDNTSIKFSLHKYLKGVSMIISNLGVSCTEDTVQQIKSLN